MSSCVKCKKNKPQQWSFFLWFLVLIELLEAANPTPTLFVAGSPRYLNHANNHLFSPSGLIPFAGLLWYKFSSCLTPCALLSGHAQKVILIFRPLALQRTTHTYVEFGGVGEHQFTSSHADCRTALNSSLFSNSLSHLLLQMHTVLKHLCILPLKKNSIFDGRLNSILSLRNFLLSYSMRAYMEFGKKTPIHLQSRQPSHWTQFFSDFQTVCRIVFF